MLLYFYPYTIRFFMVSNVMSDKIIATIIPIAVILKKTFRLETQKNGIVMHMPINNTAPR